MICGECQKGKTERVVGDGINEPPYVWLVRCPYNTEYYKYPDDECCYTEAERDAKSASSTAQDITTL